MRVNKRVVALRSGVAFPSLPPSAPFLGCPTGPDRGRETPTGSGRGAPGGTQPPPPAVSCGTAIPLPRPPSRPSPGNVGGRRAGAAGGAGGRARPAGQGCSRCAGDAPGAPCPAPSSVGRRRGPEWSGDPCAAGETPAVRRGCAAQLPTPAVRCSCGAAPLLGMKPLAVENAEVASLARLPT